MKPILYYYEHCPYCIRVLAFSGLADIELNKKILLNDDEQTPILMTGVKSLPILETSPQQYMGESLDIIDYLSEQFSFDLEKNSDDIDEVNQFLQENRLLIYGLSMPRWVNMPFAEFATDEAIAYFTNKKTQTIGDFQKAIANTTLYSQDLVDVLEIHTPLFDKLVKKQNSLATIILFSGLLGVSSVKDFQWTAASKNFMQAISKLSRVDLFN